MSQNEIADLKEQIKFLQRELEARTHPVDAKEVAVIRGLVAEYPEDDLRPRDARILFAALDDANAKLRQIHHYSRGT